MTQKTRLVIYVYLSSFLQGLTLVSFPASSSVLTEQFGLSSAQYGAIFLPQIVLAIAGSLAGGLLADRLGLKHLLWLSMISMALSQLALASIAFLPISWSYFVILLGAGFLGLGFGLAGAPLNSYPPFFFPKQRHTAVIVLHSLAGLGLALGPTILALLSLSNVWTGFPLSLFVICALLAVMIMVAPLPKATYDFKNDTNVHDTKHPLRSGPFWVFVIITIAYAFAEGTFSNWAIIYLHEVKQLSLSTAAYSLSAFWGALVVGRLLVSVLVLRMPATIIWLMLPGIMACAFLVMPYINTSFMGIVLFTMAGLGCSAFFPLTMTLISECYPRYIAWVSSMMIASLMIGVGLGSFLTGYLRGYLTLEELYQISIFYPLLALSLASYLIISFRKKGIEFLMKT